MVRGRGCRLVNCAVFGDVVREQVRQSGKRLMVKEWGRRSKTCEWEREMKKLKECCRVSLFVCGAELQTAARK